MELENVCRICESRENLRVIAGNANDVNFAMLRAVGISIVVVADRVPGYICLGCLHKLKDLYDFKSLYEATYNKFKEKCSDSKLSADSTKVSVNEPVAIARKIKNEIPTETYSVEMVSFIIDENLVAKEDISNRYQMEPLNELQDSGIKNEEIETLKDQVLHSCQQCGKEYYRKIDIGQQKKCHECGTGFKDKRNLITQQQPNLYSDEYGQARRQSSEQNQFKCDQCEKSFDHPYRLNIHKALHSNPDLYKCMECNKSLKTPSDFKRHMELHRNPDLYKCDKCGKSFDQYYRFRIHKALHLNPDLFKCAECDKSFKRASDLKRHKNLHSNPDLYKCEICGKCLSRQFLLDQHKLTHHEILNLYVCEECGKSFKLKRYLVIHKRVHFPQPLHECDKCGKTFNKLNIYEEHKALHLNPDIYKCEVCGKRFTRMEYLKLHTRLHVNPDLYKCKICGKSFKRHNTLKRHELLHITPKTEGCIKTSLESEII